MLTIWGRANSSNVMKVLWAADELGIPYERHDAGGAFGRTRDPDLLAMNPNAQVPTIRTADGYFLYESHAILRFLAATAPGGGALLPADSKAAGKVNQWMDWLLASLGPQMTPIFWGYVRTPPEKRNPAAIAAAVEGASRLWAMADAELEGRDFLAGTFSIADIALGVHLHRWFLLPVEPRPDLPRLAAWHARLRARPAFARHVDIPMT